MLGEEAVVIGMQGRESVADDLSLVCRAERVLLMDFIDVQGTETIGVGLQGRETVALHVVDGLLLVCSAERLLSCMLLMACHWCAGQRDCFVATPA